ncbi:ATP-binding protein [Enterococcus quebecensis]|uniref:Biotin carboxylase n=1 Tax=Enterococcus quebecensis TaxID=903983 RepID=A0A1E5GUJ3_9ENTE|nr:ATP-binding protein [Enterococcus quebecensis]OEG16337.1 biotin carboxylase [Enterococcus quebecensis]
MNIRKRDSLVILNSLNGGVVPTRGIQHIMVGRTEEAKQIMTDLDNIKSGLSVVRFFVGSFGSGKSFIQGFIKQLAFNEKFVVASADFSPERRLYGSEGKAVSIYAELIKNLSTATQPEGNALPKIIDRWINECQKEVLNEMGLDFDAIETFEVVKAVEEKIKDVVNQLDEFTGGFEFSRILIQYFTGFLQENVELQRCALKWLRGEYGTRTEAKNDLGLREIIADDNWYNYLKVLSQFIKLIGYSGLVVNFDEAINLYKITHVQTREKNYETILKMYNDILQGNVEGLYITFSGTNEFLEDERRGLYSYGALKRRLEINQYETDEYRDFEQPVIRLTPLKNDEVFILLQRLRDIHAAHYSYETTITENEIKNYMIEMYNLPGAEDFLTVGDIIRRFLGALNILQQNPTFDRETIFVQQIEEEKVKKNKSRFSVSEG